MALLPSLNRSPWGAALARRCGLVLALLFTASLALAEPPALLVYIKEATGECGEHRTGAPWSRTLASERAGRDPAFVKLQLPTSKSACRELFNRISRGAPSPSLDAEGDPCAALGRVLPAGVEQTCEALGYTYVGRLPAVTTPCYPRLGALLGTPCAPEVWYRALILSVAIVYQVVRKRRQSWRNHRTR